MERTLLAPAGPAAQVATGGWAGHCSSASAAVGAGLLPHSFSSWERGRGVNRALDGAHMEASNLCLI